MAIIWSANLWLWFAFLWCLKNTGHVFICLLVICKFSLERGLFKSFADFQIGFICSSSCYRLVLCVSHFNPEKDMLESYPQDLRTWPYLESSVICKYVKMRSYWGYGGPFIQCDRSTYKRRKENTQRTPSEARDRRENPVWWQRQGLQWCVSKLGNAQGCCCWHYKPRGRRGDRFFLRISWRNQPCQHLDCELLASRTIRYTSSPLSMVSVTHSQLYFPQKH